MSVLHNLSEKSLPENCYVFKHSTRCPISTAAAQQVKSYEFSMPLYWINVVEQRELSNWVEQEYKVQHQSPQLLKIVEGVVVESWTHGQVRAEEIS